MTGPGIFIISFLVITMTLTPVFAVERNGVIEMPFTESPATTDGRLTSPDEYESASETILQSSDHLAYLYVMHDREKLYVLLDFVSDRSEEIGWDLSLLCIDADNDGTSLDSEDFCFLINENVDIIGYQFDNDGKSIEMKGKIPVTRSSGFSAESKNEIGRDHRMYEYAVSLDFLHKQNSYGFFVQLTDAKGMKSLTWPNGLQMVRLVTDLEPPSKWGSIVSSAGAVTAPPVPFISVSTKSISFGSEEVSEKSTRSVTITNTGTGILKIANIRGIGEFSASGITTPADVSPQGSVTFDVVFSPLTLGEKTGTITISSNDLSNPTISIQVSGKGVEKGASPIPTGGGCLIATAAYGTELAPQVQLLRELRDNAVLGTNSGTSFMAAFNQFYYSFSPTIADWERQNPIFKEAVRVVITPILSTLSILNYVEIDSEQEMLGYGIGIILLNLGMYFVAPALIILRIRRIIL